MLNEVNGANFERWHIRAGEYIRVRAGFVMVCSGVLRIDAGGLLVCDGLVRFDRVR